ncbi:hypothetical protein H6F76_22595 [Leptolyngbya sp. FACHB-321]|uniref:hypothetical protein n=1 Tax=Leptolyngbya sp. FACHB-321 TaxID=2692807 RepID=UPI001685B114|nr:hypothetical protein [Leptolyngbya sp. FACHB-321]MBD2037747.1 hypothetical protein [Leptolyngbya sp. FACHB-321]
MPTQQRLEMEAIAMLRDMIIDNQRGKVPTPGQIVRGKQIMNELNRLKQAK